MTKAHDTKILSKTTVFKQFRQLDVFEIEHNSLQDNAAPIKIQREVLRCAKVGVVILYHADSDRLLLSQQYRIGAHLAGDENPYLFECAAGMLDPGETPEQTAIREAFEETGATVIDTEYAGRYHASPGGTDEEIHIFCGHIQDMPDEGFFGIAEHGEEIKTHALPVQDVFDMMDNNEIRNAIGALSLFWFRQNHERLRQKWATK